VATAAAAQQADWRAAFAAGEEARKVGDAASYGASMAEAVAGMPAGHLNRPFAQYHAARAYALAGDGAQAVRYLAMAWDEGIESLMISFAGHDSAFDRLREDPGYREVMARAEGLRIEVTPLGGSVSLLHGAGAQVVASVGPDGVLLVDTGYGAALPAVREALATLGSDHVAALVITHPHEDHWGGAADLASEARVFAHPGTVAAMSEPYEFMEGVVVPPKPLSLRDAVTAVEGHAFPFNGETVRIVPMVAHSTGDIAVVFPASRVLHMGDAYLGGNPMMFPGGQDPDGFLDRLESLLDTLPPETRVVGGHDAPVGLDAVRAQIAESRACMAFVREALEKGQAVEEALAGSGDRFAAPWVRYFYGALAR
jgi:glyoxylase-like metal-dependent hydrolase (beta-lactamase superfamily II)